MEPNIEKELLDMDNDKLSISKRYDDGKKAFIRELQNGLGEEIKANPNGVDVVKRKKVGVIKRILYKIFNTF